MFELTPQDIKIIIIMGSLGAFMIGFIGFMWYQTSKDQKREWMEQYRHHRS